MAAPVEALESDEIAEFNDYEFNYGGDVGSSTVSLSSSIYAFPKENGRTYHAYEAGKYLMPNDDAEQDRMDIHYHCLRVLFGDKPFYSPIVENPQRILDQCTGTGIWVMDVGDLYPSAQVIGTDLSPIQPAWVPPNVEFRVDDIEKPWLYQDNSFDLVHDRLCNGQAIKSWPAYLAEAYRVTKPGGWIEAQEFDLVALCDDGSLPEDSALVEWHNAYIDGARKGGIEMRMSAAKLKKHFEDAGLVNVAVEEFKLPLGPWAKDKRLREAGMLALGAMLEGISGLSLAVFTRLLGWKVDEMEALLSKVRAEWRKTSIHQYWPVFVVYGQKPVSEDSK